MMFVLKGNSACDQSSSVFSTAKEFSKHLEEKTRDERSIFYRQNKKNLSTFVHTSEDFSLIIENLASSERSDFYKLVRDQMHCLVENITDFIWVVSYLPASDRTDIFYHLGFKTIIGWIHKTEDFDLVAPYFSEGLVTELKKEFKKERALHVESLNKIAFFSKDCADEKKDNIQEKALLSKELRFGKSISIEKERFPSDLSLNLKVDVTVDISPRSLF